MKKVNSRINFLALLLTLGVFLSSEKVSAQRYDVGGGLGVATYSGDIVRRLDQGNIGLQGTLFGRRNFDNVWSLRVGLSYGRLSAADSTAQIDAAALYRDAFFKADVFEVSAVMEYHFLDFMHPRSTFRYSPYGFFGIGYTYLTGDGQTYRNDPLEGDYSVGTPMIPFGLGVKYRLDEKWVLAAELGFRATFSDYIDKIDSRQAFVPRFPDPADPNVPFGVNYGNYSDKDWYYFLGVTISYTFNSVKCYAY